MKHKCRESCCDGKIAGPRKHRKYRGKYRKKYKGKTCIEKSTREKHDESPALQWEDFRT